MRRLYANDIDYCVTPGIYLGDGCPHSSDRYSLILIFGYKTTHTDTATVQIALEVGTKKWYSMNLWYRGILLGDGEQYTPNFVGLKWAAMSFTYKDTNS